MYLFFDTETTGVPKNYQAKMSDLENWPRVTQLAWQVWDNIGFIRERSFLIKPDGWEVPKTQFFIDNNMSTERCEKEGVSLHYALTEFMRSYADSKYLIAHNIHFDHNVLGAELLRSRMSSERKLEKICTMQKSTAFCKLPGNKWPKLTELHQILFGSEFDGAHDALHDVKAMVKCFFKLKELGVIEAG